MPNCLRQPPLDAVLVLYLHFAIENAPTILEHVHAFPRHSRFPIFTVNTDRGFPRALAGMRFRVVVLHYSLFGPHYYLPPRFLRYLEQEDGSYRIAFFQDEHRYCRKRFEFIDNYRVDAIYSLLEPEYHAEVYGKHTSVEKIQTTLPGYVSEDLVDTARQLFVPDRERMIDIGYRARRLDYYMGRSAQEKHEIGERFLDRSRGLGLELDIETDESSRIYGQNWYRFVAQCRAMLGVEAGVSIFDLDDSIRERTERLLAQRPTLDFEAVARLLLDEFEGNIPYRTVSPRHFEAAAFRVVQILYEGHYSGVLQPEVHYLALAKDFSNFDDVMERFGDPGLRRAMTDRAYQDLVASGRYSYASFIRDFDQHLAEVGVTSTMLTIERRQVERSLSPWRLIRGPLDFARSLRYREFPGRELLLPVYRALRRPVQWVRGSSSC